MNRRGVFVCQPEIMFPHHRQSERSRLDRAFTMTTRRDATPRREPAMNRAVCRAAILGWRRGHTFRSIVVGGARQRERDRDA